jgi:hypothetical protein
MRGGKQVNSKKKDSVNKAGTVDDFLANEGLPPKLRTPQSRKSSPTRSRSPWARRD